MRNRASARSSGGGAPGLTSSQASQNDNEMVTIMLERCECGFRIDFPHDCDKQRGLTRLAPPRVEEKGDRVLALIFGELRKAETKHPWWPADQIHAAAILAEEAGEVVKAAIDHAWANGSIEQIRLEAAQTAAMAIRLLLSLPDGK